MRLDVSTINASALCVFDDDDSVGGHLVWLLCTGEERATLHVKDAVVGGRFWDVVDVSRNHRGFFCAA